MEYTDDRDAAVAVTNKSASEKHGISGAIVDALDGVVTTDRHRQETLTVLASSPFRGPRGGIARTRTAGRAGAKS